MIMPWSKYAFIAQGKNYAELEALFIEAMSEASLAKVSVLIEIVNRLGSTCACASCVLVRKNFDTKKKRAS